MRCVRRRWCRLGVGGTLWVGVAALVLPMAFLLFSPLRKMRDVPKEAAYS